MHFFCGSSRFRFALPNFLFHGADKFEVLPVSARRVACCNRSLESSFIGLELIEFGAVAIDRRLILDDLVAVLRTLDRVAHRLRLGGSDEQGERNEGEELFHNE